MQVLVPVPINNSTASGASQSQANEHIRLSISCPSGALTIEGAISACRDLSGAAPEFAVVLRIDKIRLATESLDRRAGPDTALARVVRVFGAA